MPIKNKQETFFAKTYFLTLALTVVTVVINIAYSNFMLVFYIPFFIGGAGSFLFYLLKSRSYQLQNLKLICHYLCSSTYIIGAFVLLVFFNVGFLAAWSYHIWLLPILIIAALNFKQHFLLFVLVLFIFIALFVINLEGLPGNALRAIAMGSFWGISFYFLLGFYNDAKKIFSETRGKQ